MPDVVKTGCTVLLTGLPASGKTTLGIALCKRIIDETRAQVTFLDGDDVRRHLSPDLGYSREERALHLRRLAFIATEVSRHGGITVCAVVAPHETSRADFAKSVLQTGRFVLVHVSTSLRSCRERDPKHLYRSADEGTLRGFTGVDDPYEVPQHADVTIDTAIAPLDCAVDSIFERIFALPLGLQLNNRTTIVSVEERPTPGICTPQPAQQRL